MPTVSPADAFSWIGNHLSADFANTVHSADFAEGSLRSAKDVVSFLLAASVLDAAAAAELRRALGDEAQAKRFLKSALDLRAAVREALHAVEFRRSLDDKSLRTLNSVLRAGAAFERLEHQRGASYALVHRHLDDDPTAALEPIARATAELLASPGAPVRKCAAKDCVRYFYDDSRTRRRRWCEMAICGNRAKAAAFAARQRSEP